VDQRGVSAMRRSSPDNIGRRGETGESPGATRPRLRGLRDHPIFANPRRASVRRSAPNGTHRQRPLPLHRTPSFDADPSLPSGDSTEGRRGGPDPAEAVRPTAGTLLVVDDDPNVLKVASKVLRRGGYEVLEAGSGEEALRVAEEVGGKFDLLLTDVVMPGMGGRQVGEGIRARFPKVRVLYMSAYTEDDVLLRGIRGAEAAFISKPFTVSGLRDKVRTVLEGRPH